MSEYWIPAEWLQRLAGSLLHFVWQGALLAFLAAVLLRLLARREAALRYAVAVAFLGVMLLTPGVTFVFYPETGAAALRLLQLLGASLSGTTSASSMDNTAQWTGWIVIAWLTGVTGSSIRLMAGWLLSVRLIHSANVVVPTAVEQLMQRVQAVLLTTQRSVRLLIGGRVSGPVVFGWLRPVVLLPASAVTGLTEQQLLAILAHELAHVRRHDFFINALQRGVESVLFYHPAVWWLSSRIRTEREHCCDDLAVSVCGDRFAYAGALIELERMRDSTPALAVAAGGRLVGRIRRLLGVENMNRDWQPATAALLLVALCALGGRWQGETIAAPTITAQPPAPPSIEIVSSPQPAPIAPIESPLGALAAIATAQPQQTAGPGNRWVTTWATFSTGPSELPCCNDQTVRLFIRVSIGGKSVRVRLSNAYGRAPLFLGRATVALHDRGSEIVPGSSRSLLFGGKTTAEIPVGETVTSDAADLEIPALGDLAISLYAPNETGPMTIGSGGRRAGYVVTGEHANAQSMTGAKLMYSRPWISSVEVLPAENAKAVLILGGSNLLGSPDTGRDWPTLLETRLQGNSGTRNVAIVASDGLTFNLLDPKDILSPFDHVVASPGSARKLLLCPDLGFVRSYFERYDEDYKNLAPGDRVIRAFQQRIDQAKARGMGTIGCTIGPEREVPVTITGGESQRQSLANLESARVAVNEWIRASTAFEGVVDIDAVTRNPAQPSFLATGFRSSPNSVSDARFLTDRAHQAIADAIDLSLFAR